MTTTRQMFHPFWNQLDQLQNDVNRLFGRWSEGGSRFMGWSTYPSLNVWEEGDTLHVEAELPGLKLADLEIFVTGTNQLTLKGERKADVPEQSVQHRQERGFGKFVRSLTLPFAVDADNVDARFENGVLQITLHKHESAKARKIVVKGETKSE